MKSVIIVGQGIAGTVLAETFLARNYKVYIFDASTNSSSSLVAAGVYNPIIAKRITTTWMAEELLPASNNLYQNLQKKYLQQILFPLPLLMVFDGIEQQNNWATKASIEKYKKWTIDKKEVSEYINQPFGGQWFTGSGYVDTQVLISGFKSQNNHNLIFFQEVFESEYLQINESHVSYKNLKADYIFYCEGVARKQNVYFDFIPFKPAKGELLTIRIENLNINHLIQAGIYVLPKGNDTYIVGATYDWKNLDEELTENGKLELLNKLDKLIQLPYQVIDHKAGIRPAVADRRPVLGFHSIYKNVGIFNGLGTKGVMLAPYFAEHLVDVTEKKVEILSEVDVNRFNR